MSLDSCDQKYLDAVVAVYGANGQPDASTIRQNADAGTSSERTMSAMERFALIDALTRAEGQAAVALSIEGRGPASVITATFRLPLGSVNIVDAATLAAMVDATDAGDPPKVSPTLGRFSAHSAMDANDLRRSVALASISGREREVLTLVASGQSNKQIGASLGITEDTAKVHMHAIFRKLGVANRSQAAVMAYRLGLEG